jgi:putative glutathione S-transferase
MIGLSVTHWLMGADGWHFEPGPGVVADPFQNASCMHQVYTAAKSDYTGRVTVPVLWDKAQDTIVSNESADIIRMFNNAFDDVGATSGDYYPEPLRAEIDALNARIYDTVSNGVYKAGFATSQGAYEAAVMPLFEMLDELEVRLEHQRFLVGSLPTEADWRLFPTLVRFDAVYHGHFKCSLRRLMDYPNLWAYTRDLYAQPGVAQTINMDHVRQHYYGSHESINPTRVVPVYPPAIDFTLDAGRERLGRR